MKHRRPSRSTGPLQRFMSAEEILRIRDAKAKLAAARQLAGDTTKPAPPTADELRVAANDKARHAAYDADEAALYEASNQVDLEDARQREREHRRDLDEGRIPELRNMNPGEDA